MPYLLGLCGILVALLVALLVIALGIGVQIAGRKGAVIGPLIALALAVTVSFFAMHWVQHAPPFPTTTARTQSKPLPVTRPGDVEWKQALAAYRIADFSAASTAFSAYRKLAPDAQVTLTEVDAHLLGAQTSEASALMRRLATQAKLPAEPSQIAECVALYLEARTGSSKAESTLEEIANRPSAPMPCGALAAESLTDVGRKRRLLAELVKRPKNPRFVMVDFDHDVVELLHLAEGGKDVSRVHVPLGTGALSPEAALLSRPLGVLLRSKAKLGIRFPADRRLETLTATATGHSYLSNHLEAARTLQDVFSLTQPGKPNRETTDVSEAFRYEVDPRNTANPFTEFYRADRRREGFFLAAVLALRAKLPVRTKEFLALIPDESWGWAKLAPYQRLVESAGTDGASLVASEADQKVNEDLWSRVEAKDALGLSQLLIERRASGHGIVPFVVGDWSRASLSKWLEEDYPELEPSKGFYELLRYTAAKRECARALENQPVEVALAPVAERLWTAWTAPSHAVVLHALARVAGL